MKTNLASSAPDNLSDPPNFAAMLALFGPERSDCLLPFAGKADLTREGPHCGDPWRTWRSPPPGEMVPNPSDWRRANWDHIRMPVPCLSALAPAARRAHCWLRTCILPAGNSDSRALTFRPTMTPCHSGSRENEHTPWLLAYLTR